MSAIGIDLGTTNSVVAIHEGSQTTVIVNAEGARTTPSVVVFTEDARLVGRAARSQAATNPTRTISSIKRLVGRRREEVSHEETIVPYKVVGATGEPVKVEVDGKAYSPVEISAMILQDLKKSAEAYLGHKVSEAVITVPAYFNDAQRQATKDAGEIAGLKVLRIINEPTAAALAYGTQEKVARKKAHRVAVFDLGGGTFDISILDVGDGVFEVLATNGDTHLGGDDWDRVLVDYFADEFKKDNNIDLHKDSMALQRLVDASEKVKCDLSKMPQTTIALPYISATQAGPKHLQMGISRAAFEIMTASLFARLSGPVEQCLKDAKLKPEEIDEVVLVGGSTRMPKVIDICKSIFKGKVPNQSVNPDEVVAVGAAIQAAILGGQVKDIVLVDVTPLSLGVETVGGVMSIVIEKNSSIPTKKSQTFTTASDSQPAVEIHVLQGERAMVADNRTLGRFMLMGIPPARRGIPQIEVSFDMDTNGILNVSARDKATNKEQKIEIKSSSGLTKDEIAKMVAAAKEHEEDDKKRAGIADARNKSDGLCYQAETLIEESGAKMPEGFKKRLQDDIKATREAMLTNNAEAIVTAAKTLNETMMKIGEMLYTKAKVADESGAADAGATTTPADGPGPAPEKPKGQPVEGEFKTEG